MLDAVGLADVNGVENALPRVFLTELDWLDAKFGHLDLLFKVRTIGCETRAMLDETFQCFFRVH